MEIRDWLLLPFADPACGNKFSSCGEIAGDAKGSILMARCQQVFKQLVVPERCFDKKLCLLQFSGAAFQLLTFAGTFRTVAGQVTVKGKMLSVETLGHTGEDQGHGPHKRHKK